MPPWGRRMPFLTLEWMTEGGRWLPEDKMLHSKRQLDLTRMELEAWARQSTWSPGQAITTSR